MDNCTRENQKRYLIAYLECLVGWFSFDEIVEGYFPVGHPYEDIDQTFSCTLNAYRHTDAITLHVLHEAVTKSYNHQTTVITYFQLLTGRNNASRKLVCCLHQEYLQLSNISSLVVKLKFLFEIHKLIGTWKWRSLCKARQSAVSKWAPLPATRGQDAPRFIKVVLDTKKITQTRVAGPIRNDQFINLLILEESRINDPFKMKDL